MKSFMTLVLAFALVALSTVIEAQTPEQSVISGVTPRSRTHVDLYPSPDEKASPSRIAVKELSFPIAERQVASGGFIEISLEGKTYWIHNSQVRRSKPSKASCPQIINGHKTGWGTPGVSRSNC